MGTAQCVADWPIIDPSTLPEDMEMPSEPEDMGMPMDMGGNEMNLPDLDPVDVEAPAPPKDKGGCQTQESTAPTAMIILFLPLFFIRRRWSARA